MDITQYIKIIRRWLWLIVLAAFIVGSFTFISRTNQPRIFETSVKVIVGNFAVTPDPNYTQIQVAIDLTETYLQIVTTSDVLTATIDALDLSISEGQLRGLISTTTLPFTSIIVITVRYTDPVLAADIANELANQLIAQSPTNLTPAQETQLQIAQDQIDAITVSLESLRKRKEDIDRQIEEADGVDIATLNAERITLTDQINEATSSIAIFSNTITGIQQRTNTLSVIEEAKIPGAPIGTGTSNSVIFGVLIGATLAVGFAFIVEYLSDTFRTADEVVQVLNLPVVGAISKLGKTEGYADKLISNNLFSQSMEEYRGLRINLLHGVDNETETKVFVVTSPVPSDGKTLTACNLALSIAFAEKRVLLIDADLRRPKLHSIFGVHNQIGLSTFLSLRSAKRGDVDDATNQWQQCLQYPGIENLSLLTTGFSTNSPTELLGSNAMRRWIETLKASGAFDVVVFDTSPCLAVSDPVVLASAINAEVLLVLSANRVKRNMAQKAKERFVSVSANLTGVVLNNVKQGDETYYGYYAYYASEPQQQNAPLNGNSGNNHKSVEAMK